MSSEPTGPSAAGSAFPEAVGFHLDLRIQVMRPRALRELVEELAGLGLNTLVMEWEASFPYFRHATISGAPAYSPEEARDFLAHCRGLGLTVIPLQQTLGHLEYVLRHPRYAHLRESEDNLCQLCPCRVDEARALMRELFEDMREFHDGPYIHLGGDEAYLLGDCPRCARAAGERGLSYLYSEYMNAIIAEARAAGFRPLLWADMILKHPECAGLLPRDTILVDWNYGWARDRFGPPETLLRQGFTVWGAAALRSSPDNHSRTEWRKHLDNFRDFIPRARDEGYRGMLLTSWSTSGLYGYNRDDGGKVLDLLPVRRVYPLNGHRLLLRAFAEAIRGEAPIRPEEFLARYGKENFGLDDESADDFSGALLKVPGRRLADLRPGRAHEEWRHLLLIEAFAEVAAEVAALEAERQSPAHDRERAESLRARAAALAGRLGEIEATYAEAQAAYLAEGEAQADTAYRGRALLDLLARVGGEKN